MAEVQEHEVSRKTMAFESISGSVVTEHTGDNQGGEDEEYYVQRNEDNGACSSVANSSNNSHNNEAGKIREHDYIGLNSDSPSLAAVDKPEEERSSGVPDLNLGLGIGPPKSKDELLASPTCEDGGDGRVYGRLKLPVCGKRGYSEVGMPDLVKSPASRNQMFPWSVNSKTRRPIEQHRSGTGFNPFQSKPSTVPERINCLNQGDETPSSSGPVVGWPPVQSFRKNTLVTPPSAINKPTVVSGRDVLASTADGLVKVYMDGVPIGRKVDLDANNSYTKLSLALKEMFSGFINGQSLPKLRPNLPNGEPQQQTNLFDGHGAEYVLTYEDKDGDLMLVGDVPWRMFAATVKRLRIMKGSDANGLGVPKGCEIKARS